MTFESITQLISACGAILVPFAIQTLRGMREDAKAWRAEVKAELKGLDERLREVEDQSVRKSDWVRTTLRLERQQTEVIRKLENLDGKVSATIGIDANLRRIAQNVDGANQ